MPLSLKNTQLSQNRGKLEVFFWSIWIPFNMIELSCSIVSWQKYCIQFDKINLIRVTKSINKSIGFSIYSDDAQD